ncbi:MAG TPA: protein kinase [Clostridiaceae bacterium]|nr:protein kinase [Clostridiaceae bacterium]
MNCGEMFQGKYKIIRILGQGGMGKVYLAENIRLGTLWAIKEIQLEKVKGINVLAEANILKRLNHPALPRIFDIFEEDNKIYIIFDYIEGISLEDKLKDDGKFSENTVIEWGIQICNVLIYLHSIKPNPIIYRDLKPSNIILTQDGSIKLVDFGIAREYKENADKDTVYIGTRGYAAPEQYGKGQTNPRTDIYNLGATLHHLITGKSPAEPPFEFKPVRFYDNSLSEEIEFIIAKCVRNNPEERFATAEELLEQFMKVKNIREFSLYYQQNGMNKQNKDFGRSSSGFRKLVFTVWDNAEFGCEFAYLAARLTVYNIILVDLDLLAPKADLCLNVGKISEGITREGLVSDSSIGIAMDFIDRNCLDGSLIKEISVKRRELKNLYILTGNYNIENYEYFSDSSLERLIEKCYQSFDITVLLVNRSIYDSYTVISLLKSDYNLVPARADVDKLREINSQLVFLKNKQRIELEKTKIIAFEYDPAVNLSRSALEELTSNNYLGSIRYSVRRAKYRNLKLCYARRMEKEVMDDYKKLLCKFSIIPKKSGFERLREILKVGFVKKRFQIQL